MFLLKISKKSIIIISTYTIFAFAVVCGFIIKQNTYASSYKRQTEVNYARAFSSLADSTENMYNSLRKVCCASSPSLVSSTCTQVYADAMSADAALGVLPYANSQLENTAAFISKTGDYVFYLSRYCAAGNSLSDEHRKNLETLCQNAETVSNTLSSLSSQLLSGSLSISSLEKNQDILSDSAESAVSNGFTDSFKQMETEFPQLPTLIYDGPFSSHISSLEPKFLDGKKELSENDVLYVIQDFSKIDRTRLKVEYQREEDIPVYVVTATTGSVVQTFEVTRTGGFILYYGTSRAVPSSNISQEKAISIAETFLNERGLSNMSMTYYDIENNILVANFAYKENNILYYPDLVKVGIAMNNGEIVNFETAGYIMNHTVRNLAPVKVSQDEAQASLADSLEVLDYNLCVIPTSGKNELLCHEFKCSYGNDQHCLVYINAETGIEEKILILLENEKGTLTV